MDEIENKYKVRLVPISSLLNGAGEAVRASQVAFDVTPQFSESRTVEYTPVTPVHMPGAIQIYKHTNSRNFEISATMISRNVADALKNMANLQKLRGWMMPYFGATDTLTNENNRERSGRSTDNGPPTRAEPLVLTAADKQANAADRVKNEGVQLRGAPPDVLYLYAYSTSGNDSRAGSAGGITRVNINKVPVVLTSLSIAYPDDVDYLPVYDAAKGGPNGYTEPFPKKLTVTVSLVETHSPREYERFDLAAFKLGNLIKF